MRIAVLRSCKLGPLEIVGSHHRAQGMYAPVEFSRVEAQKQDVIHFWQKFCNNGVSGRTPLTFTCTIHLAAKFSSSVITLLPPYFQHYIHNMSQLHNYMFQANWSAGCMKDCVDRMVNHTQVHPCRSVARCGSFQTGSCSDYQMKRGGGHDKSMV